jgi:hypothetical protein
MSSQLIYTKKLCFRFHKVVNTFITCYSEKVPLLSTLCQFLEVKLLLSLLLFLGVFVFRFSVDMVSKESSNFSAIVVFYSLDIFLDKSRFLRGISFCDFVNFLNG